MSVGLSKFTHLCGAAFEAVLGRGGLRAAGPGRTRLVQMFLLGSSCLRVCLEVPPRAV